MIGPGGCWQIWLFAIWEGRPYLDARGGCFTATSYPQSTGVVVGTSSSQSVLPQVPSLSLMGLQALVSQNLLHFPRLSLISFTLYSLRNLLGFLFESLSRSALVNISLTGQESETQESDCSGTRRTMVPDIIPSALRFESELKRTRD